MDLLLAFRGYQAYMEMDSLIYLYNGYILAVKILLSDINVTLRTKSKQRLVGELTKLVLVLFVCFILLFLLKIY